MARFRICNVALPFFSRKLVTRGGCRPTCMARGTRLTSELPNGKLTRLAGKCAVFLWHLQISSHAHSMVYGVEHAAGYV